MADLRAQQLQTMQTMLAAQQGVQPQQLSYQPMFAAPSIAPQSTFSLAQQGQRFMGEGGAVLGMVADIMLPQLLQGSGIDYQGFVTRLSQARSGDPMAFQQQQRMQGLMQTMGVTDINNQAAALGRAVGISDQVMNQITPFIPLFDQLSGGMVTETARMFDPAMMTATGANAVVGAQRRLDTMGRIDEARALRMQRQMQERLRINEGGLSLFDARIANPELSEAGFRLRDDTVTSGFNADEFAQVVAMSADLGIRDRTSGRSQRETTRFTQAAARDLGLDISGGIDSLGEADRRRLRGLVESQQRDAELIGGAQGFGNILQTLRNNLAPDMDVGQLGMLARDMGFVPSSGRDTGDIEDAIRQIRALGDAAGMSTEQMVNAGQTLQRQYGGTLSFNMASTAAARSMQRVFMDRGAEGTGIEVHRNLADERSSDAAEALLDVQGSLAARLVASANMDDDLRAEMEGLETPEEMAAFIQRLADDPEFVGAATRLSRARVAMGTEILENRMGTTGAVRTNAILTRDDLIAGARARGTGRASGALDLVSQLDELSDDDVTALAGAIQSADLGASDRDALNALGASEAALRDIDSDRDLRNAVMVEATRRNLDHTQGDRRSMEQERELSGLLARSRVAGLDVLMRDLADPDADLLGQFSTSEGAASYLQRVGLISSDREDDLTRLFENSDLREDILEQLNVLTDPSASSDTRSAAESRLQRMGLRQRDQTPGAGLLDSNNLLKETVDGVVESLKSLTSQFMNSAKDLGAGSERVPRGGGEQADGDDDADDVTGEITLRLNLPEGVSITKSEQTAGKHRLRIEQGGSLSS